jgi:hypothetical protein
MSDDASVTSSAERSASLTCAWCGTTADEPQLTWTVQSSERGVEYLCQACTRTNVRQIEGQLPAEWW